MRQIGGDTRGSDNVIQRKLGNLWRELEKQTQWLTDASVGTQNGNFLSHCGCGRVEAIVVLFGSDAQDAAGSVGKHDGKKSGMDREALYVGLSEVVSKIRDSHTGRIVFVNSKDFLLPLSLWCLVRPF